MRRPYEKQKRNKCIKYSGIKIIVLSNSKVSPIISSQYNGCSPVKLKFHEPDEDRISSVNLYRANKTFKLNLFIYTAGYIVISYVHTGKKGE